MPRRPIVLLIVFLAVAVLLIGSRVRDQSPVSAVAPQPDMSSNAAPETATVPAAVDAAAKTSALLDQLANGAEPAMTIPPPAMALAPLPSWDAKLVDVLPELRARADAGDVQAACHLGLALSACASFLVSKPSPAELRNLPPEDDATIKRYAFASMDFRRPGREATCEQLSDDALASRFKYLQQAADGGNEAAMLAYIEGSAFPSFSSVFGHAEELEQYRLRTPRYVGELLRRGSRNTAMRLRFGSDGYRVSFLGQVLATDSQTAATFHELGRLVLGDSHGSEGLGHSEAEAAMGRSRAQAIFARYFEFRAPQKGEFNSKTRDLLRVESCVASP